MSERFEQWAILEIMGHQRYAGLVSEQAIGGASFVRIDVPENGAEYPAFTKLFGAGSIYAITPVAEHVARMYASRLNQSPVSVYDLPEEIRQRIRRPLLTRQDEEFDDDDDDGAQYIDEFGIRR